MEGQYIKPSCGIDGFFAVAAVCMYKSKTRDYERSCYPMFVGSLL